MVIGAFIWKAVCVYHFTNRMYWPRYCFRNSLHQKAGNVQSLPDGSFFEHLWGEIFRIRPNRPPGPSTLLYSWYQGSLPGLKLLGCGVKHTPHLAPSLKEGGGTIPLLPSTFCAIVACYRVNFRGLKFPQPCVWRLTLPRIWLCVCVCVRAWEQFLTLQRRCFPSKHQKLLIQSHSIVSQKTLTLNNIFSYSRNCAFPTKW
jgi:hypothetical protein